MTKGMGFDENMEKVNWSFVRVISNFGYQFMPKEKGVKYKKCEQAGVDVELVEVKGTFHAFTTIGTGTPETKRILEENIKFMNKYI